MILGFKWEEDWSGGEVDIWLEVGRGVGQVVSSINGFKWERGLVM